MKEGDYTEVVEQVPGGIRKVSTCCKAPLKIGGKGQTHWYICKECNLPTCSMLVVD